MDKIKHSLLILFPHTKHFSSILHYYSNLKFMNQLYHVANNQNEHENQQQAINFLFTEYQYERSLELKME